MWIVWLLVAAAVGWFAPMRFRGKRAEQPVPQPMLQDLSVIAVRGQPEFHIRDRRGSPSQLFAIDLKIEADSRKQSSRTVLLPNPRRHQ